MNCRTLADIEAAGAADGIADPPYTQAQMNELAVLLAPHLPALATTSP